ncbi:MAG TPA: DCC1-like thiol-disulfide oxidoreductase family protein [Xanthobacteraceae bacterium]|nr:DCC1-like thiol-disulfide oxidoreductase family protein [Xanthobacteraceae bacterium]
MEDGPKPHEAYSYRNDSVIPTFPDDKPIIVYDGHCGLCSGWVRYVLRHDRAGVYRFLSAQSALGHALYVHYGLDPTDYETNILIAKGVAYYKSEACLRMAEGLGFPSSLASIFRILPMSLRDRLYGVVARNRLRIFGRLENCYLPVGSPDSDRFIA